MEQQQLVEEIKKLNEGMDNLNARYSALGMFWGGMLRGMGILVGATLLVLAGSAALKLLGFLPGFEEIVRTIVEAFEKAQLHQL